MSNEPLAKFPVVIEIPVQWGEMDAYRHVNNTVVFRFFESARIAFLVECNFIRAYDELKIGAILHSTACRFRQPVNLSNSANPVTTMSGKLVLARSL